jgi:hypothetical protein
MPRCRRRSGKTATIQSDAPIAQPVRKLTIIGQDPTLRSSGRILTATVRISNEELSAGPRGYCVRVVDCDASTNRMFVPLDPAAMGTTVDPKDRYDNGALTVNAFNERLLRDLRFHAQNVYAIVMRTLWQFERALG